MPSAKPWAEVWGQPISHSLSPTLHQSAYKELGLDWEYRAREVGAGQLAGELGEIDSGAKGLSLTMPLKEAILELVPAREAVVDVLGAANTLVFTQGGPVLTNTDYLGVEGALQERGVHAQVAWIIGAGATARAVGYALAQRGVRTLCLVVRNPTRAEPTARVLEGLGVEVLIREMGEVGSLPSPELVVSTLPGGLEVPFVPAAEVLSRSVFFDVAYHPWPSHGATLWAGAGSPVISGLSMLTHQALHQVRWFVNGQGETPLPNERGVLLAMKSAVGLPAS